MYTQIVKPNLLRVFLSVILATIFTLFSWSFDLDTAQELGEEELEQVDEEILVTAQKHMEDNNIGQAAFFKDKDGKHAAFFLSPEKGSYIFTKDSQGNVIKKGGKTGVSSIDTSPDYLHLKRIEVNAKQHDLKKIQSKAQGKIETKYGVKQLSSENNHSMLTRGKELKELYNNIGGAVEISYAPGTTIADYKGLLKERIKDQYNVTPIGSESLEITFDRGKGLQELYNNVGQKLESSRKYQDKETYRHYSKFLQDRIDRQYDVTPVGSESLKQTLERGKGLQELYNNVGQKLESSRKYQGTEKVDHYSKFLQNRIDRQYDVTPVGSESLKQTLERGENLKGLRDAYGKDITGKIGVNYHEKDTLGNYEDRIVQYWESASGLSNKLNEEIGEFVSRARNQVKLQQDSRARVAKGRKQQQPPTSQQSQQKGIMQGKKPQQHSQAAPDSVKEAEQMKPEVKQKTEEARGAARTIAREKEKDIQQKTKEKSWFSKLFDSDQDKE